MVISVVALYAAATMLGSALGCDHMLMFVWAFMGIHVILFVFAAAIVPTLPLSWKWRAMAVSSILLMISVMFTHWPLRITFAAHRSWLDSVADRVKAGDVMHGRQRVGLLSFRRIFLRKNGNVGFQLSGDAGGGMFLVRNEPDALALWYNCATLAEFGGEWYLVDED